MRFAPWLPCQRFRHWPDQCLRARRNFLSLPRDQKLATAFPSPVTGPPFRVPIPGSLFPACRFAPYAAVRQPVRPFAPLLETVCPVPGRFVTLARRWFATTLVRHSHGLRSPGWTFPSTRDQSVLPRMLPASPPSHNARFPLAPRFPLSLVLKTDQRSWFATFREAGCSSNLLEPHSLCSRVRLGSRKYEAKRSFFINLFLVVFQLVDRSPA